MNKLILWHSCQRIWFSRLLQFFQVVSRENCRFKEGTIREITRFWNWVDSIEKIFDSLKNEISIKPLRVWSDDSIYGAIILAFIVQLFISLMRYDFKELKHRSTKFIKKSLKNLTLTVKFKKNGIKEHIFANFDKINNLIVAKRNVIT